MSRQSLLNADGRVGRIESLQGRCHSLAHMSLEKPAADPVAARAAPVSATARSVSPHTLLGLTQLSCLAAVSRVSQPPASEEPPPFSNRPRADARVLSGGQKRPPDRAPVVHGQTLFLSSLLSQTLPDPQSREARTLSQTIVHRPSKRVETCGLLANAFTWSMLLCINTTSSLG